MHQVNNHSTNNRLVPRNAVIDTVLHECGKRLRGDLDFGRAGDGPGVGELNPTLILVVEATDTGLFIAV